MTLHPPKGNPDSGVGQVTIGLSELISLMSAEVARQVVADMRENELTPLETRLRALEEKTRKSSGVFEGMWKAGVIALAIMQGLSYLFKLPIH